MVNIHRKNTCSRGRIYNLHTIPRPAALELSNRIMAYVARSTREGTDVMDGHILSQ